MRGHPLFFVLPLIAARSVQPVPAQPGNTATLAATVSGEWTDLERSEHRLTVRASDPLGLTQFAGFFAGRMPLSAGEEVRGEPLDWTGAAFAAAAADGGAGPAISAAAGALEWEGLPALLRDPLARSLPRTAGRGAAAFGPDADASPEKPLAAALYAALPGPRGIRAPSASLQALWDETSRATAVGALRRTARDGSFLRTEALYSASRLPRREADAWFDEEPPLPERNHSLSALGLTGSAPNFAFLLDAAVSDAESSGRGAYARTAAEFGPPRARTCLSADAATPRFIPLDGAPAGTAYRAAADYRILRGGGGSVRLRAEGETEGKPEKDGTAKISATLVPRRAESGGAFGLASVSGALDSEGGIDGAPRDWGAALAAAFRVGGGRKGLSIAADGSVRTDGSLAPTEYVAALRFFLPVGGGGFGLAVSAEGAREEPVRYGCYASASVRAAGGYFSLRAGTDDRATWELLTHPGRSASALGPWTVSLRWSFAERREPRTRGVDQGLEAAGVTD